MSQKKLKEIRRLEGLGVRKEPEFVFGVRQVLRANWKFLTILILGIVVLYFNSLWGAFVSDDYATIPQNPQVTSIKAAWSSSFFINLFKTLISVVFSPLNRAGINSLKVFWLFLLNCLVT